MQHDDSSNIKNVNIMEEKKSWESAVNIREALLDNVTGRKDNTAGLIGQSLNGFREIYEQVWFLVSQPREMFPLNDLCCQLMMLLHTFRAMGHGSPIFWDLHRFFCANIRLMICLTSLLASWVLVTVLCEQSYIKAPNLDADKASLSRDNSHVSCLCLGEKNHRVLKILL